MNPTPPLIRIPVPQASRLTYLVVPIAVCSITSSSFACLGGSPGHEHRDTTSITQENDSKARKSLNFCKLRCYINSIHCSLMGDCFLWDVERICCFQASSNFCCSNAALAARHSISGLAIPLKTENCINWSRIVLQLLAFIIAIPLCCGFVINSVDVFAVGVTAEAERERHGCRRPEQHCEWRVRRDWSQRA